MSIEKLLELSRAKLTPEQLKAMHEAREKRFAEMDREHIERNRCRLCGVDRVNYSHTFDCPRRGGGL